jgi:glycosyltransferase involved in cell wall biosynthesis
MKVTVAICTLNHADTLRGTLESLTLMNIPDGLNWEVVVVNNGCTDNTDEVLQEFSGSLPLRVANEPKRGLARARNRAVGLAMGDYIIWTDDDVVVDRGWLAAYIEAFRRRPEAAVFGGRIVPQLESPVPKWVSDSETQLDEVFARRDLGYQERPLWGADRVFVPWGPSFAVRAKEQREFHFNTDLGPGPGQRRRGEETDVIERIMRSGATGYWVPNASVKHRIRRDMQTINYISEYYKVEGETNAYHDDRTGSKPTWFGVPHWAVRQLIEGWVHFQIRRVISPASVWLRDLKDYSVAWGAIRYWRNRP